MGPTNRQPDRGGLKADDAGRDAVVALKDGAVRGIGYDTYSVFYSIPYAAPPSGAGRFRAPEPPLVAGYPRCVASRSDVTPAGAGQVRRAGRLALLRAGLDSGIGVSDSQRLGAPHD